MGKQLTFFGLAALLVLAGGLFAPRQGAAGTESKELTGEQVHVSVTMLETCDIRPPHKFGHIEKWWDDDDDWRNDREGRWEEWIHCILGDNYTPRVGSGRKRAFEEFFADGGGRKGHNTHHLFIEF